MCQSVSTEATQKVFDSNQKIFYKRVLIRPTFLRLFANNQWHLIQSEDAYCTSCTYLYHYFDGQNIAHGTHNPQELLRYRADILNGRQIEQNAYVYNEPKAGEYYYSTNGIYCYIQKETAQLEVDKFNLECKQIILDYVNSNRKHHYPINIGMCLETMIHSSNCIAANDTVAIFPHVFVSKIKAQMYKSLLEFTQILPDGVETLRNYLEHSLNN